MFNLIKLFIVILIKYLVMLVPVLISVAYMTIVERKVIGEIQKRMGPNVVGVFGLLQPFADALKLIVKEDIVPKYSIKVLFISAPIVVLTLALVSWSIIPLDFKSVAADLNLGVLFLFVVSSLAVYGIILAGWSSNSKYAFLGALRSAAQMISYEVSIGLVLMPVIMYASTLNMSEIVLYQQDLWLCVPLFPLCIIMFISLLAETNRAPFDLPEAEAELVAGFNVEYSSIGFALFFLGEYANIILMSTFAIILFFGG